MSPRWTLAIIILVPLVAAGVYYQFFARPPLAGETAHHFGIVRLPDDGDMIVQHSFTLRNNTSDQLRILDAKTSCGCTSVVYDPPTVPAGEQVTVSTALKIISSGQKHEYVHLVLEDHGLQRLDLFAESRRAQPIRPIGNIFPVRTGEELPVSVERWPDDPKNPPTFTAPPGVTVELTRWYEDRPFDKQQYRPAQWKAAIRLHIDDLESIEDGVNITAQIDNAEPIQLTIPVAR